MTPTPTESQEALSALVALSEKATAGPWLPEPYDEDEEGCGVIAVIEENGLRSPTRGMVAWCTAIAGASFESPGRCEANTAFIAALVNWFREHHAEMVAAARQAYWNEVGATTGINGMRAALEAALSLPTGDAAELPELPEPGVTETRNDLSHDDEYEASIGYTADQMRAYAAEHSNYWQHMHRAANKRAEGLEVERDELQSCFDSQQKLIADQYEELKVAEEKITGLVELAEEYADLKFRLGAGTWTYEQRSALAKECDAKRAQLRTLADTALQPGQEKES